MASPIHNFSAGVRFTQSQICWLLLLLSSPQTTQSPRGVVALFPDGRTAPSPKVLANLPRDNAPSLSWEVRSPHLQEGSREHDKMCNLFQRDFPSFLPSFHIYLRSSTLDKGISGSVSLHVAEGQSSISQPRAFWGSAPRAAGFPGEDVPERQPWHWHPGGCTPVGYSIPWGWSPGAPQPLHWMEGQGQGFPQ